MAVSLVDQLYFVRTNWRKGLAGITDADAEKSLDPINTISWMVGHLAAHEQFLWLKIAQGREVDTAVDLCKSGQPPIVPPYDAMFSAWEQIIIETNVYLDVLTPGDLTQHLLVNAEPMRESIGTSLYRLIYHYWYHLGEMQAVRQLLGHKDLPSYVGPMSAEVRYRTDTTSTT